jgi:hypothetical protein
MNAKVLRFISVENLNKIIFIYIFKIEFRYSNFNLTLVDKIHEDLQVPKFQGPYEDLAHQLK